MSATTLDTPSTLSDDTSVDLAVDRPVDRGAAYVGRRFAGLVLVLGSLAMLGPLTIDTYLPAFPQLAADFHASDAQVQLTLTAMLFGLGVGQLLVGPLSDAVGRRRPLMTGLVLHALASLLCALAPTIATLTAARLVQGLAGAAVAVVAAAIVRDLFTGTRMATVMSRLVLVMGLAPIIAPTIGSAVLQVTSWHGVFVVVSVAAIVLLGVAARWVPETLEPARRLRFELRTPVVAYAALLRDRSYLALVGIAGMAFATLFAYVGGSSFVLQDVFHLDTAQFGLVFGINSAALTVFSQINPTLVRRYGPVAVLRVATVTMLLGAITLLALAHLGIGGVVGFVAPVTLTLMSVGLVLPNCSVVALAPHGDTAGTAAAMIGALQFAVAAAATPVVGALADGTARPVGYVMVAASLVAVTLMTLVGRRLRGIAFG
ncbi:MAG TPA: multidrug effflux MFS transporter [Dermatophilaceae bacterium]|nr:multidrug effflux MFS transporter [Dermatophilaceae bacterium]